jgi:hypothetical protein
VNDLFAEMSQPTGAPASSPTRTGSLSGHGSAC